MKVFILITLCLVLSQQQGLMPIMPVMPEVLIASSSQYSIIITSPPLQTVVALSVQPPTTIEGTGAQWIHKSGGTAWPEGDVVTFYT